MTSKIINMAERMKDAEDRQLESMFDLTPIADDGFSGKIVRKLNRSLWIRRLTLPIAAAIGGAIALKSLSGLVPIATNIATRFSMDAVVIASNTIPPFPLVLLGAVFLIAGLLGAQLIED